MNENEEKNMGKNDEEFEEAVKKYFKRFFDYVRDGNLRDALARLRKSYQADSLAWHVVQAQIRDTNATIHPLIVSHVVRVMLVPQARIDRNNTPIPEVSGMGSMSMFLGSGDERDELDKKRMETPFNKFMPEVEAFFVQLRACITCAAAENNKEDGLGFNSRYHQKT